MRRPGIWWIGLAAAAALAVAAIHRETPRLERELTERAEGVLRAQPVEAAQVFAEGRDLRIAGSIVDDSARQAAVAAVSALPGVRRVDDSLASPSAGRAAASPGDEKKDTADNPAAQGGEGESQSTPARAAAAAPPASEALAPAPPAPSAPEAAARRADETASAPENGVRESQEAAPRPAEPPPSAQEPPPSAQEPPPSAQEPPRAQEPPSSIAEAAIEPRPPVSAPENARDAEKAQDDDCRAHLSDAARSTEIGFPPGGAGLSSQSMRALKALAAAARRCPTANLRISGFARVSASKPEAAGSDAVELSWRRAEAAAAFLLAEGVPGQQLEIAGLAEDAPASSADRRVEIQVK